jgi:endonuclease/exonuclease/phosphatase (EEP) superfamily protein YafD
MAKTLSDEKKTILQTQLHQLQHLTWDECSMMGFQMLNVTNERCCLIKREDPINRNFGNINVLAVGDLYQLPPVGQKPMYKRPTDISCIGDLAPPLWHDFQFHELTQIMRQKDIDFATLLNEVRVRVPCENDHVDVKLKARELTLHPDHPAYPKNVLHVYAENQAVGDRNKKMLEDMAGNTYYSKAKDSGDDIKGMDLSKQATNTGNLQEHLELKVGARVILTNNMDVPDGLTNGAYGTIHGIISENENALCIKTILVRFDSPKVGICAKKISLFKKDYGQCVPIKRVEVTFAYSCQKRSKTVMVTRCQFPLFLAWAVTIHKVQGMTLDEIVVDMSKHKGTFRAGQAYVGLSRVTSYDKLHIIGYNRAQFKVNREITTEMGRLRQKEITPPQLSPIHNKQGHFKIGHLNINGGLKGNNIDKSQDIQLDEDMQCLDVLCLTETHLNIMHEFSEDDLSKKHKYGLNRRDRGSDGGGVIMAVMNDHMHSQIDLSKSSLEIVCSAVRPRNCKEYVYIFCVYIPPTKNKEQAALELDDILKPFNNKSCIVLGDINEDIMHSTAKSHLHSTLTRLGFQQHINHPTTDHASLLDHIYTHGLNDVCADVQDAYYSDHDKTLIAIKLNKK